MEQIVHTMTLRLSELTASDLESVSRDLSLSKSAFIRRSIRRAIEHARQYELPLITQQIRQAIQP